MDMLEQNLAAGIKLLSERVLMCQKVRSVKTTAISELNVLVEKFTDRAQEKGIQVHHAKTGGDALEVINQIVKDSPVVKARSAVLNEIGLGEGLQKRGIELIETQLGEVVMQRVAQPIRHPILTATGLTHQQSAGSERERIREAISKATVGITGATSLVAEHGTVVLVEDEGNARAVSNIPPIHLVVAGIEKIVPQAEDAIAIARAASVFGTGKEIARYISLISGPSSTGDIKGVLVRGMHGPKEVHVVLLDNGRRQVIAEGFSDVLACIHCGSCLRVCPLFHEKGAAYGYKYLGGRGLVFTSFHAGLEVAETYGLNDCQQCGKCVEVCPVTINVPSMIARLRKKGAV